LPNKNILDFHGKPMFMVNVKKCLEIFDLVYVSSDSLEILKWTSNIGAIPILRGEELCGDIPNIPVYQHALGIMPKDIKGIIAVQVNSPTVSRETIMEIINLMQNNEEVITVHEDGKIYGSVWGISRSRLNKYSDFYHPNPEKTVVDNSIDIHTIEDYNKALVCVKS